MPSHSKTIMTYRLECFARFDIWAKGIALPSTMNYYYCYGAFESMDTIKFCVPCLTMWHAIKY